MTPTEVDTCKYCQEKIFTFKWLVSIKKNDTFSRDDTFLSNFSNTFINYP